MSVLKKIRFMDSTLRDGSHAVGQKILPEQIAAYCQVIDQAGMHAVIVGHGNGLGASSIQMGLCAMDELEMLSVAAGNLRRTALGTFVTIGFGTIRDQIIPAIRAGAETFCIAAHCTEADTMRKHVEYLYNIGREVYGVLMNIHLASPEKLLEQAKLIQSYGADGIILMDSAGASTPEEVKAMVGTLYDGLEMEIGFHPHNNLGLGVSNAYTAILNGASIIDGTVGGFGAGAGNCQLEALLALLMKEGIQTDAKLYPVLDAEKSVIEEMLGYGKAIDGTCVVSGYAGVVSTFKNRVERVAEDYCVDARDVFVELGKRGAIAGQDDLILEVAQMLSHEKYSGR